MTSRPRKIDIGRRLAVIWERKSELATEIDQEHARPAPCGLRLQELKRRRLRLKDAAAMLRRSTLFQNA